jgi:hypothetical protein
VGFAIPLGHPDSPVMIVFGEAVRLVADALGDASPRRGPVLNRIAATYGLLSEQQGTNHRTGAEWLK